MIRQVKCAKLGIEAEGLDMPPFPGAMGQEIFEKISKQAWKEWLVKQTMLINEGKLTSFDPKARAFLAKERTRFLFEGHHEMPEGYVPPKTGQ
jgi:Fe-S cluster biosynthesis and repair protein YggX